jgi:hypothetical protein
VDEPPEFTLPCNCEETAVTPGIAGHWMCAMWNGSWVVFCSSSVRKHWCTFQSQDWFSNTVWPFDSCSALQSKSTLRRKTDFPTLSDPLTLVRLCNPNQRWGERLIFQHCLTQLCNPNQCWGKR